jgi:hypothetical protein
VAARAPSDVPLLAAQAHSLLELASKQPDSDRVQVDRATGETPAMTSCASESRRGRETQSFAAVAAPGHVSLDTSQ